MVLFRNEPSLTLIWHKAHSDQRPHISQPHWSKSYLHDKDFFIYQIYLYLQSPSRQVECNIVLRCPLLYAMFLRSKTLLAGHDHLITPNTEFLMGHYGRPFSGSGSVSANRWNRVLSGHRLHRQNISTDPPSISCLPNEKKQKNPTGNKSSLLPYQSQILTSSVLVEQLRDGRYLSKAINLFQGEAKANSNSPQRICWYNRLGRAAL